MRELGMSVITAISHIRWGVVMVIKNSYASRIGLMRMRSDAKLDSPT